MSEVDATREVEDFFNEEIFGAKPPPPNGSPMPEGPPPVLEVDTAVPEADTTTDEAEPESEETPAEEQNSPVPEVDTEDSTPVEEPVEPEAPEELQEDEALAWARKKYGELDPEVLARAAFEQEKLLGKKAQAEAQLRAEHAQRELQMRIDALNQPGHLTPDEDNWVNEALLQSDPGEWAWAAHQQGRDDLYSAIINRWSTLGETEARRARVLDHHVVQFEMQPRPDEKETVALQIGKTFISLGLDIDQYGPLILAKADELGAAHPAVRGMTSEDEGQRLIAVQAIVDLIAAGRTTVAKARTDDVVEARLQEEKLRQQAAGVETGGPRVEPPKRSPFWEQFDEELAHRGWDGNRPSYGQGE